MLKSACRCTLVHENQVRFSQASLWELLQKPVLRFLPNLGPCQLSSLHEKHCNLDTRQNLFYKNEWMDFNTSGRISDWHCFLFLSMSEGEKNSPGKLVLAEGKYFTTQFSHNLALVFWSAMLQHMLQKQIKMKLLKNYGLKSLHHVNATNAFLNFGRFAGDAILCSNFFSCLMFSNVLHILL